MRQELNEIQHIESYLLNQLSDSQRKAFEQRLSLDANLQDEVEIQRQLTKRLHRKAMATAMSSQFKKTNPQEYLIKGKLPFLNSLNVFVLLSFGLLWLVYSWNQIKAKNDLENQFQIVKTVKKPATIYREEILSPEIKQLQATDQIPIPIQPTNCALVDILIKNDTVEKPLHAVPHNPSYKYLIDPTIATVIVDTAHNTVIRIPEFAFIDINGNNVHSPIEVEYEEFYSKGCMVISKIPMHWIDKKGVVNRFHSAGMFSLKAYSDGEEVFLNQEKPKNKIHIEFALSEINDSLGLYFLNEKTGKWDLLDDSCITRKTINTASTNLNPNGLYGDEIQSKKKLKVRFLKIRFAFNRLFRAKKWKEISQKETADYFNNRPKTNDTTVSELRKINSIQQLAISQLGTYNYDLIRKMPNRIQAKLEAMDQAGIAIPNIFNITATDPHINGAYHFGMGEVFLSPKVNYDLFVFTTDKRIFFTPRDEYKMSDFKHRRTNKLRFYEVTDFIKKPDDINRLIAKGIGIIDSGILSLQ